LAESTGDEEAIEDAQDDSEQLLGDIPGRKFSGQLFKGLPNDGRPMPSGVIGVRGDEVSL